MGTRRKPSEQLSRRLNSYSERPVKPRSRIQQFKESDYWLWAEVSAVCIGLVAIIPATIAFWIDLGDRKLQREAIRIDLEDRKTQRIAQAWDSVTRVAPGNSGKGPALEYLNSQNIQLKGINLSTKDNKSRSHLSGVDLSRADLFNADLSRADLTNANLSIGRLSQADLSGAILVDANLSGTIAGSVNLSRADLSGADLSGASLTSADLSGADLTAVDLSGADLTNANLSGADLTGADLSGANLEYAYLTGAVFTGTTLFRPIPYIDPLTRERLLFREGYNSIPWGPSRQFGGLYIKDRPPSIDPALLVHFTAATSHDCYWFRGLGLDYVQCAGLPRLQFGMGYQPVSSKALSASVAIAKGCSDDDDLPEWITVKACSDKESEVQRFGNVRLVVTQ